MKKFKLIYKMNMYIIYRKKQLNKQTIKLRFKKSKKIIKIKKKMKKKKNKQKKAKNNFQSVLIN